MKKVTVEVDNQHNIYCTMCPRHCYFGTLARDAKPITELLLTDSDLIKYNVPENCPVPNE